MSPYTYNRPSGIAEAASFVRSQEKRLPELAVILGSGLGGLVDEMEEAHHIPSAEIPGYPISSVPGHAGELAIGTLEGRTVLAIRGRVHCYEGYSFDAVTFPVSLAYALGARKLVVTNAAGGICSECLPGSVMLISDHLNLTQRLSTAISDCIRPVSDYYDPRWRERAYGIGLEMGLPIHSGVYVWTLGPSYETKAEIRFFRHIGADAVGMSTVPEVVHANQLGMTVLGISTITNSAAGMNDTALSHEDVLAVGASIQDNIRAFLQRIVADSG